MRCVPVLVTFVSAVASVTAFAHHPTNPGDPNPSPNATVTQTVGYTTVSVSFGRPGVKGRLGKIWGELVPYNEGEPRPWLAGANGNAVITFDEGVEINGQPLAAGSYGLMMIPAKDEWTIIFSENSAPLGILAYTPEQDALRIKATPEEAHYQEWLIYEFRKTGELEAQLDLRWERLRVGFTITAPDHREESESEEE